MAVRNKRCRNCPESPTLPAGSQPAAQLPNLQITSESEGKRLWHHVLFGTGTCISMIEGYQKLGMPGHPVDEVKQLIARLSTVLSTFEVKNEVRSTEKRQPPARKDNSDGRKLDSKSFAGPVTQPVRSGDSQGSRS